MDSDEELESILRGAVRAEASKLDRRFDGTLACTDLEGVPPQEAVSRALARIRQRDAAKIGRLGERVARVRLEKSRIPSPSGSARFRVPDILTDSELIEIKNVKRLALTPKLLDFYQFAEMSGLTFVLVTRFDTILAPDLRTLIDSGRIEHRHLTGLLSPTGRRLIRRLIDETFTGPAAGQ